MIRSWTRAAGVFAAGMLLTTPVLGQTAQQRLQSEVQRASQLVPHEAAALVTAQMLGSTLPDELSTELLRFFRDFGSDDGNSAPEMGQFAENLTQFLMGVLASGGPLPVDTDALGLPAVPGLPPDGGLPDLNALYALYGLANTLAYVTVAVAVPDLGPWVLPHNIRVVASHVQTDVANQTVGRVIVPLVTGGVNVGDSFTNSTTIDIDTLIGTALDQHTVNDLILIQVPLSTTVAITATCTATANILFSRRCTNLAFNTTTILNDKVLATNPSYTVAYPLNAGTFATRVEATDLFQVVYDALGHLNTQKPRELTAASPFASIPGLEFLAPGTGLADLATQAPPVNFYGAQLADATLLSALSAGIVNPLLTAITEEELDVRTVPASALNASLSDGLLSLSLDPAPLDPRVGVTAGYRAEEVRTGNINIMVLRWHNVGTETAGTLLDDLLGSLTLGSFLPSLADPLGSAPASIYYDVPAGEYSLTNDRVDGRNAVFVSDFAFAAAPPSLTVPPNVPDAADLESLAEQLQVLLGGELPELPELPGAD